MKRTFIDVVLELPVDATLRDFLTSHELPVPNGFAWEDTPEASQALVQAIQEWPDSMARDQMIANLMASITLANAKGKRAIFEAVLESSALTGLVLCSSDLHRSFWLYVNHLSLFERASDFAFWEQQRPQSQHYDLDLKRRPRDTPAALTALCQAISAFYKHELSCGDSSLAYLVERTPGVFLLTVHVKDLAAIRTEFEGNQLTRRVGNPNIPMALEYSQASGVVRARVRGGYKYQRMLVEVFAEHILGAKTLAERIKSATLDLSMLPTGFDVPQVFDDGFVKVQVKSLTLLSPDAALKVECTAMHSSQQRSVQGLLQEKLPGLLDAQWTVNAAQINLYYPPEPGRMRAKSISIELTRAGRLNLEQFDAKLQAQLEGYLVTAGILHKGQTLSAQVKPAFAS